MICSLTSDYGIRYALRASLIARPRLAYKDKKRVRLECKHSSELFSCLSRNPRKLLRKMGRASSSGRHACEPTEPAGETLKPLGFKGLVRWL